MLISPFLRYGDSMNDINQLKLIVYESHMSDDDKFLCIDAIESCKSNTEFYKIHRDILDIVESADDFTIQVISIHDDRAKKYIKPFKNIYNAFDKLEKTSDGELLINADNDEFIGCVFVGTKKDKGYISNLKVMSSYRRQGYGTMLLKDAIQKFHGADLTVDRTNEPAIKLYKKFGFREIYPERMKKFPYYWMKRSKSTTIELEKEEKYLLNKVKEFNTSLNSWKYGVLIGNKIVTDEKFINWDKYKTIPIDKIEKYHVGICWDFVNYEHFWLNKNHIQHTSYFFVMSRNSDNTDIVTHTFIIVNIGSSLYWIESSWLKYQGVHKISSVTDVVKILRKTYGMNYEYDLFTYNPTGLDQNLSNNDFFKSASDTVVESVTSTLDDDFISEKQLSLSKFKKVILTEDILDKIDTKGTMLCHLDLSDICYGWLDKNKIVGYVAVSDERSGRYITALEVCNEYRSHGLGKQILKFAVNTLDANKLTVAKTNQIAIKMYTDFGFKKVKDSSINSTMITMKI